MTSVREPLSLRVAWIALAVVALATLAFGIVALFLPDEGEGFLRTVGVASIGMGLFGGAIALGPFRRRERWAWLVLWYWPLFWLAHLAWDLPPGEDHVHQVLFIAASTLALAASWRAFFRP